MMAIMFVGPKQVKKPSEKNKTAKQNLLSKQLV